MGKILIEISEGELLDKISILEIKLNKIKNPNLLKEVKKEYEILNGLKKKNINFSKEIENLYLELKETNIKIWQIENDKRLCEKNSDFSEKFIKISRDEYFANDRRAKIKSKINILLDSNIKEVKEHIKY
jgi:post-segregation antitoxin (ccd killing protein)|tara:strand:- start:99 stop:488 length:390 start_codon:yes stop_codon:yes gene_type:complete